MWHIWVQAWLITHFFMFHSLQPWQLLHVWQKAFWRQWKKRERERESLGREHKGRVREGGEGRESEQALSSWPTSSVIMPWSRNEAFGSTPGFWEQRCELLMLAVGPAWHPLPFPSSPCLGRAPVTPPQPCPSTTTTTPHPHWNCKEDQNKERDLFFTRLLLWPNDITSAASSPQIPAAQHIFPLRRRPSILFEFHHFIPISKQTPCPICVFNLCCRAHAAHHFSASCNQGYGMNLFRKPITHIQKNRKQLMWQMDAFTLSFRAPQILSVL